MGQQPCLLSQHQIGKKELPSGGTEKGCIYVDLLVVDAVGEYCEALDWIRPEFASDSSEVGFATIPPQR